MELLIMALIVGIISGNKLVLAACIITALGTLVVFSPVAQVLLAFTVVGLLAYFTS